LAGKDKKESVKGTAHKKAKGDWKEETERGTKEY
jgi:hypothetical protein